LRLVKGSERLRHPRLRSLSRGPTGALLDIWIEGKSVRERGGVVLGEILFKVQKACPVKNLNGERVPKMGCRNIDESHWGEDCN